MTTGGGRCAARCRGPALRAQWHGPHASPTSESSPTMHLDTATTTPRAQRRAPRWSLALALGLAALLPAAVSGCSFTNPQITAQPYLPADGEVVDLGDGVVVASLHVVTRAQGEPGVLLARVVNASNEPRRVSFTAEAFDEVVTVPPEETLEIGGVEEGSTPVLIESVTEAPGLLLPVVVAVEGGATEEVQVPVMDGTFEYYEPYLRPLEG